MFDGQSFISLTLAIYARFGGAVIVWGVRELDAPAGSRAADEAARAWADRRRRGSVLASDAVLGTGSNLSDSAAANAAAAAGAAVRSATLGEGEGAETPRSDGGGGGGAGASRALPGRVILNPGSR
jgi:hypothetical protein